ncbi:MAG: hypothetical protein ACOCP9_03925, partial [Halofilum sp. (in: g-proteobacteria)]
NNADVGGAEIDLSNGRTSIFVDDGNGTIDDDGSFDASGLTGGEGEFLGEIEGRFLGTNAEGALVAFEVGEVEGDLRIVGSRVLD